MPLSQKSIVFYLTQTGKKEQKLYVSKYNICFLSTKDKDLTLKTTSKSI